MPEFVEGEIYRFIDGPKMMYVGLEPETSGDAAGLPVFCFWVTASCDTSLKSMAFPKQTTKFIVKVDS